MLNKSEYNIPAIIMGVALIIASVIAASTFYSIRSLDNSLSVTGSAKVSVKADIVKWTIQVNRVVYEGGVSGAYSVVADNVSKVKQYLIKNGVTENEISVSPIFADDYWSKDSARQINVRQMVTVNSKDVTRIKSISENTSLLAAQGVVFSPNSPEYYVSGLPELRISLIGEAITDARARAESIAKATGQRVGKLKSASSGVVQVLQTNSNDVSDYGQYDTMTIDKDVMVSVRASFGVR